MYTKVRETRDAASQKFGYRGTSTPCSVPALVTQEAFVSLAVEFEYSGIGA